MGPQRPALRLLATHLQTLLHLAAWCQLGVIVRIELTALFGGACASRDAGYAWAPCVTSGSGALFMDLPANALGSFVMGLLASSDVLSKHLGHVLADEAPLAVAPRSSSLQVHSAFHIGLRTGFCGSLTTFSSWMLQVVVLAVGGPPLGGSKWVEALFAVALNAWVSMAALVTGQHVCLMVYHWLNPGAFTARGEYGWLGINAAAAATVAVGAPPASGPTAAAVAPPLPPPPSLNRKSSIGRGSAGGSSLVVVEDRRSLSLLDPAKSLCHTDAVAAALAGLADEAGAARATSLRRPSVAGSVASGRSGAGPSAGAAAAAAAAEGAAGAGAIGAGDSQLFEDDAPSPEVELVVIEEEDVGYPIAWRVADAASAASLAALTGVSLWWAAEHLRPAVAARAASPFASAGYAASVLLGPPGALLRFYLARLNGRLPGRLRWFPAGTFAANVAACVLDFAVRAGADTSATRLPRAAEAMLAGVMTGFCGSLSTVSTWVVELQLLMLSFPAKRHGYDYLAASVVVPFALGLLIYGTAVWTALR